MSDQFREVDETQLHRDSRTAKKPRSAEGLGEAASAKRSTSGAVGLGGEGPEKTNLVYNFKVSSSKFPSLRPVIPGGYPKLSFRRQACAR